MPIEFIPKIIAVILAAICAGTDFVWGKVFNKAVSRGLIFAVVWLGVSGLWTVVGGKTAIDDYPELGLWKKPPKVEQKSVFGGGRDGPGAWNQGSPVSVQPSNPKEWKEVQDEQAAQAAKSGVAGKTATGGEPVAGKAATTGADAVTGTQPAPEPSWWIYAAKMAINALLAFTIGILMWWFGMWAAGDAKLFGAIAAILPLSSYVNSYWPIFPGYVLIFNTFIALLGILVLELVVRFVKQIIKPTTDESEAWKTALEWIRGHKWNLVRGFFGILFFMLIIKTLRMLTRDIIVIFATIDSNTLMYVILFIIFQPLAKAMQKKWVLIPMVLFTIGFTIYAALFPTEETNVRMILQVSGLMLGVVAFLIVYQLYLNVFDFHPVRIWELRPRMLLARKTLDVLKEDQDMLHHKMGPIGPDGLSAEQTENLRRWWIDRGKGGKIWISRTIPFAPALLIGTLITVILSGYVFKINQ
jgi:Flp pilus assembly protein protease CpaA